MENASRNVTRRALTSAKTFAHCGKRLGKLNGATANAYRVAKAVRASWETPLATLSDGRLSLRRRWRIAEKPRQTKRRNGGRLSRSESSLRIVKNISTQRSATDGYRSEDVGVSRKTSRQTKRRNGGRLPARRRWRIAENASRNVKRQAVTIAKTFAHRRKRLRATLNVGRAPT